MALWGEADMRAMSSKSPSFADTVHHEMDAEPIPTIGHIGRYALKDRLGEGGIGTVYAAHDPLLSRLIAVKTLHLEVAAGERESFNAMFLDEARAAGGLNHTHIVTVFDAGISDDRAYIAMELLKGRDLRQLRREGWRPTPAQAALIVRRVADALGYAHSKGVVHRDVKPANIFMIGRTQPKVLDFGIARVAHRRDASRPNADIAAGSPYYMAPEQARHEDVDRRADVFSLGVVLYELLTDQKPFRGATLDEIIAAVTGHEPPLAHLVNPLVPEALADITAKAMAKAPDHRYRSARAFARELRQWLDENTSSPDGEPVAVGRKASPVWYAAAAIGALLIGVVAWKSLAGGRASAAASLTAAAPARTPAVPAPAPAAVAASATSELVAVPVASAVAPEVMGAPPAGATPADATLAAASAATAPGPAAPLADAPALAPSPVPASATVAPAPMIAAAAPVAPIEPMPSAPAAGPAAAPVKTAAAAAPKAPKETLKERRAREARERDAKAAQAAPKPAPAATGLLRIAISPWGELEVDGKPAGTSPPLTELNLPEGRHQIVVRNTDLPSYSTAVTVTADQPVVLKYKF